MNDYISREEALAVFGDIHPQDHNANAYRTRIKKIPIADVRPVVRGENITENDPVDEFVCGKCGIIIEDWSMVEIDEDDGERTNNEYVFRYCPNCGADMREEVPGHE